MIVLHASTLQLLITMCEPEQFAELMEDIELIEDKNPFISLTFGDNPVGETPDYDDPRIVNFRLN